jgi:hypothetical protein
VSLGQGAEVLIDEKISINDQEVLFPIEEACKALHGPGCPEQRRLDEIV